MCDLPCSQTTSKSCVVIENNPPLTNQILELSSAVVQYAIISIIYPRSAPLVSQGRFSNH